MSTVAEPQTIRRQAFQADIPFTRGMTTEESGDLLLQGYANTWVQDRYGDYVQEDAFDKFLQAYLSKNPILLYGHNMSQGLGVVESAKTDSTGLFIEATVPKPQEGEAEWKFTAYWNIRNGIYRTFSIGGFFSYTVENVGEDDEKWLVTEIELLEISVVGVPANPDSIFEAVVKSMHSDGDRRGIRMAGKAFEQMVQLLGFDAVTDPDLRQMDDAAQERRYGELAKLFELSNGRKAPGYGAYRALVEQIDAAPSLSEKVGAVGAVQGLAEQLYAPPEAIAREGRVLSKDNEDRIRAARDALDAVLTEVSA